MITATLHAHTQRSSTNAPNPPEHEEGGSTPEQYGLPPGARELQDLIEYRNMNFAVGNIFKAAFRLGNCAHSDKIRDLNKILWFASREKERLLNNMRHD